jgi:hypothetical protein
MRRLILILFFIAGFPAVSFACDDAAIGAQITATWKPQLDRAKGSICETAKVMQGMLTDTKSKIAGCLTAAVKQKALAQLDVTIRQWRQTQSDACK